MIAREFDVVVLGAGGAGMMCAIWAARRNRKVLLVDHSSKIGRKILISGGGRCNFTNINTNPSAFVSANPHFCKSALARFTPDDFLSMVRAHCIPFHEKKLGQLFCDNSAQSIVDLLVAECKKAGAVFELECQINSVAKGERFIVHTNKGSIYAESLVVATGGLSIPQIGATGLGYSIAEQFELAVVPTAPALVGLHLQESDKAKFQDLAGVSIDTDVTCKKASFRENILFTHTGLSGPAILQASLYWQEGWPLEIDLYPSRSAAEWLFKKKSTGERGSLQNVLSEILPRRFAEKFCDIYTIKTQIHELSEKKLEQIGRLINAWTIHPLTSFGYKKAEVTRGGVDTKGLSSQTMESNRVPGLYFVGEVVDVTGLLGGYNFQWAWASGFAAGQVC